MFSSDRFCFAILGRKNSLVLRVKLSTNVGLVWKPRRDMAHLPSSPGPVERLMCEKGQNIT